MREHIVNSFWLGFVGSVARLFLSLAQGVLSPRRLQPKEVLSSQ